MQQPYVTSWDIDFDEKGKPEYTEKDPNLMKQMHTVKVHL